jgi:penicillin amidase
MLPYPGEPPAAAADLAALYRRLGIYRDTATPSAPANTAGSKPHGISVGPQEAAGMFSRQVSQGMLAWAEDLTRNAGTPEGKGSNNWVVAGTRTVSGKPLLANDPHLGLSAPAIWYFARLQAPASVAVDGTAIGAMDAIGATLPGLPFVVLGRTDSVAWGFTNTGPDVQDLYLEQINPADPTQYRTPEGWMPFAQRTETIRVKGQPDVVLALRATRHGPVLSDVQKSHAEVLDLRKYVLALRWNALDADNQTVLAGLQTNQAKSVQELFHAFEPYHSPMQSVVAARCAGKHPLQGHGQGARAPRRQ